MDVPGSATGCRVRSGGRPVWRRAREALRASQRASTRWTLLDSGGIVLLNREATESVATLVVTWFVVAIAAVAVTTALLLFRKRNRPPHSKGWGPSLEQPIFIDGCQADGLNRAWVVHRGSCVRERFATSWHAATAGCGFSLEMGMADRLCTGSGRISRSMDGRLMCG